MNTHTKGPWKIEAGAEYRLVDENNQTILLIGDTRRLIPSNADARLIVAAPALLEALQQVRTALISWDKEREIQKALDATANFCSFSQAFNHIEDAIQLATGKGDL